MTDTPKLSIVPPSSTELSDPLDLNRLRRKQNFTETAGVKKLLITLPVRKKPNPHDFNRLHPSPEYRAHLPIIEVDREIYVVDPDVADALGSEVKYREVCTAVTAQGAPFLWVLPAESTDDKRENEWNRTNREAANQALTKWTRMSSSEIISAYEIRVAEEDLGEPIWPEQDFQELIRIAFRQFVVDSLDHAVVKRLRGRK
jgi:hypothetical protein